jgi:acyl-coenzyme A thioesterase PaaI-like protein
MSYPPDHPIMRDLRPWTERGASGSRSYFEVVPEACGRDGTVLDLSINYLSLVKIGPARTSARILRSSENEALVRVELKDRGNENRLCTVATALVSF